MMSKTILLLTLLLSTLAVTTYAASYSLVDASPLTQKSDDPDYDKMVVMHNGDVKFHWKEVTGNTLNAKLVHNVPTAADLPSWVGWGIYDSAQLNDGSTIDAAVVQELNSNAVIAAKKPSFSMQKYSLSGAQLWKPVALAKQSLLKAGFGQSVQESDGSYNTMISFEKLLKESDTEEVVVQPSGPNVFWWGWGSGEATAPPEKHGAFVLDLSTPAGTPPAGGGGGGGGSGGGGGGAACTPGETDITLDQISMDPDPLKADWLLAHNKRRTAFFTAQGATDVPMVWSTDLARSAQRYADKLIELDGCVIMHKLGGDHYGGENLYKSWAKPPPSSDKTPEDSCMAWFEGEEFKEFPNNGHRTQVAWRASKYVGCGQATKTYNGEWCFISACRYMAPANCNVRNGDYMTPLMKDASPCGEQCPKDMCC